MSLKVVEFEVYTDVSVVLIKSSGLTHNEPYPEFVRLPQYRNKALHAEMEIIKMQA